MSDSMSNSAHGSEYRWALACKIDSCKEVQWTREPNAVLPTSVVSRSVLLLQSARMPVRKSLCVSHTSRSAALSWWQNRVLMGPFNPLVPLTSGRHVAENWNARSMSSIFRALSSLSSSSNVVCWASSSLTCSRHPSGMAWCHFQCRSLCKTLMKSSFPITYILHCLSSYSVQRREGMGQTSMNPKVSQCTSSALRSPTIANDPDKIQMQLCRVQPDWSSYDW